MPSMHQTARGPGKQTNQNPFRQYRLPTHIFVGKPFKYIAVLCNSFSGAFSHAVTVYAASVPGCSYDRLELVPARGTYM